MKIINKPIITEEIVIEVKYKITYPDVEGARQEAVEYALGLPFDGVMTIQSGSVSATRVRAKAAE